MTEFHIAWCIEARSFGWESPMEFLGLFHIFTRESDVIDFWEGLCSIILDLSRWELHWAREAFEYDK